MSEPAHRAGLVVLLGRPNAGKSTLLNHLVGRKLAIVTPRPQTTRSRILGIRTEPGAQLLLLDTPGLHTSEKRFNTALREQVVEAAADCDVAALLFDLLEGWGAAEDELLALARGHGAPVVVVGTQLDRPGAAQAPWPPAAAADAGARVRVSARSGDGVPALLAWLVRHLPVSPALYPADQQSDRPLRFLAAELVREAATVELAQELPYSLAVEVVEFDESDPDLVRIRADLLVERSSQKPIAIGRGGEGIKRIGTHARREIETLLGCRVYLDLWVKVEPRWARRPSRYRALGYR